MCYYVLMSEEKDLKIIITKILEIHQFSSGVGEDFVDRELARREIYRLQKDC